MNDLMERADPAKGIEADVTRIRAKIDERIGISAPVKDAPRRIVRPWMIASASFAAVILVALPFLLPHESSIYEPQLDGVAEMPGIESVTPLASGGIQTMAVDGDTIWVVTGLQDILQEVDADSGEIRATYPTHGHVEGVVVGGGYVWLMSYENGGEVLRFDPEAGGIDATVSIGGMPGWARWFGEALWMSNDQGEVLQISPAAEIVARQPGELIDGTGLTNLWIRDPETGMISSLAEDGIRSEVDNDPEFLFRKVIETEAGFWMLDGDFASGFPSSPYLSRWDTTGAASVGLTFGLLDMIEFNGFIWATSNTDHMLLRIDPNDLLDVIRYPLPGKAAGLETADGSLWVLLNHPGALVRLNPDDLIESAEITADAWDQFPHRLLCTGTSENGGPTVILEPYDWLDYGSWSVIQARLSNEGYRVCANGYVEGEATPQQRAADLEEALTAAGIGGPFVLVATGDGVHATRLFADGRNDVSGLVLVDPSPVGFQEVMDDLLPDAGAPPWVDISEGESESLGTFGSTPLTVIGQDPEAVFLNERFVDTYGADTANALNDAWQEGLAFYGGLSTDSRSMVADGTGMHMVIWDLPDLVVGEILGVIDAGG